MTFSWVFPFILFVLGKVILMYNHKVSSRKSAIKLSYVYSSAESIVFFIFVFKSQVYSSVTKTKIVIIKTRPFNSNMQIMDLYSSSTKQQIESIFEGISEILYIFTKCE